MINNRLLWGSAAALVFYWIAGLLVSGIYTSRLASLAALAFGFVAMLRYSGDAYDVVFKGVRSSEERGAHMAIYGLWLVSFGAFYIGAFGLLWIYWGQPASWLDTAFSGFGRACMAAGFAFVRASPDFYRKDNKFPAGIWIVAALIVALLAAFQFGVRVGEYQSEISSE